MPTKKRASTPNEYESDDGFVEDAPRSKKAKKEKNTTKSVKAEGKGEIGKGEGEAMVDDEGQVFWELSGKRRIGVQEFKGNVMVNIREYYEKDGAMLPGKKGIALPIAQFNTIISVLPQLEKVLMEKGEKIGRPGYEAAVPLAIKDHVEEEEGKEDVPGSKAKKNFEETSDEE